MTFIRNSGLNVPKIIPSKERKEIETLETDVGSFFAVVFEDVQRKYVEYTEMKDMHVHESLLEHGKDCVARVQLLNLNTYLIKLSSKSHVF